MRIQDYGDGTRYVIAEGKKREKYFFCLVDRTKVSWTTLPCRAEKFDDMHIAQNFIDEIRYRSLHEAQESNPASQQGRSASWRQDRRRARC